jgi:hypothetical protein
LFSFFCAYFYSSSLSFFYLSSYYFLFFYWILIFCYSRKRSVCYLLFLSSYLYFLSWANLYSSFSFVFLCTNSSLLCYNSCNLATLSNFFCLFFYFYSDVDTLSTIFNNVSAAYLAINFSLAPIWFKPAIIPFEELLFALISV